MSNKKNERNNRLSRAKNRIRGATNKQNVLFDLRQELDLPTLQLFAKWSYGWLSALGVLGKLKPKRLSDLNGAVPFSSPGLRREIEWIIGTIARERQSIEKYLQLRHQLEESLLSQPLSSSLNIIEHIEQTSGFSLQALSLRIALEQLSNGLEAQKELVNELRRKNASPVALFYCFWFSVRAEDGTTSDHFVRDVKRRLQTWDIDPEVNAQLHYYLLNEYPPDGEEHLLLANSTVGTAVDTYELFIGIATTVIAEGRANAKVFQAAVDQLSALIPDSRLNKMRFLYGTSDKWGGDSSANIAYREAQLTGLRPDHLPTPVGPEEFAASTAFASDGHSTNPLSDRVRSALSKVASPGDDGLKAAFALSKLGLMLGHTSLGRWISAVARSQAPGAEPFNAKNDAPKFVFASDAVLDAFNSITVSKSQEITDVIASIFPDSIVLKAAKRLSRETGPVTGTSLTDEQARLLDLKRAAICGATGDVLSTASKMLVSKKRREPVFLRHAALLDLGHVREALQEAILLLAEQSAFNTWLPLERLTSAVYLENVNRFPSAIETPILFHFASSKLEIDLTSYTSYTSEDYVLSHGSDRPSKVDWYGVDVPAHLKILFLAEVCSPTTLRLFSAFESERELEEERIAICQILARIDSENREQYEEEALNIVTSRLVKEAIKQLQASKISIDEDAISSWCQRNVREDFLRYQSLHESGLVVVDQNYRETVTKALETGEYGDSLYDVPENEAGALFTQIISQIVARCAFDPEHGLDCYLSLRIRHGTLSGTLRSAPETEHVVTRRAGEAGDYKENSFWKDATTELLSPDDWELIQARLDKFSGDFDKAVSELTSDFIQVKRAEKPNGLIELAIPYPTIYGLATEVDETTDFETFVSKVIEIFWALVQVNLLNARRFLDKETRDKFRSLFNNLEFEVRQDLVLAPMADAIIRARNEFELSLDRVRDWFELPTDTAALTFTVEQLIEVSLEAIKSFHRDFSPNVTLELDDTPPLFNALNLFSDIFFVIFENIYTHCGSTNPQIKISADLIDKSLRVRVENSMSEDRCGIENMARVSASQERIRSGAYLSDLSKEGGTGLPKLAKLINYNSGQAKLDFALNAEQGIFGIEFSLPARVLEGFSGNEDAAAIGD